MTALVYSKNYQNHETGTHPENQGRVRAIMDSLNNAGLIELQNNEKNIFEPEMATGDDLRRVHPASYVDGVREFCEGGGGHLDLDTVASPLSYETAKLSAGGAIKAADLVLNGWNSAYSIGRPPGHHAKRDKAMGFCIFNNIAITLEYLREVHKIKKFLIFDFDVHYGNGTADIFYEDPDVLYISIHQDPRTIFPGVGLIEEIGYGGGEGCNLNIPMPPGSTTSDYRYILERILRQVAEDFHADFYLMDVGFDGHLDDPLSRINLGDDFYEWIGMEMMDIAGSLVLILEGGYDLNALRRCNVKLINGLNKYGSGEEVELHLEDLEVKHQEREVNHEDMEVRRETKETFKEIKEVFSPFYEL